jgi:gliding motility-associated-like protein
MIRLRCLVCLLSLIGIQGWTAASAQNLVPNFSFEDSGCSGSVLLDAQPWFTSNGRTVDSYHSCKALSDGQIPNNWLGFQQPYDGQGYAGIIPFLDEAFPTLPSPEISRTYREYLAVRLIQPLVAGISYNVSFKYSVADKIELATDDLGIYISKTPIPSDLVLTYTPQIRNPAGHLLTNTTTWETLGGSYTAEGGEEYIVIGCFKPYEQLTISNFQPTIPRLYAAYVYIDYVVIEPCTNSIPPQVLGDDRAVCQDFSPYQYNLNFPNTTYTWQDGTVGGAYTVTAPGDYWVKTVQNGCAKIDYVNFSLSDAYKLDLGKDTTLCPGTRLSLSANVSGTFRWQDGSTNAQYTVKAPGLYSLEVQTPDGCSASDDIKVSYDKVISVDLGSADITLCEGEELTLAPVYEGTYTWQDGSADKSYIISQAGEYWLAVTTDHGCVFSDDIVVTYKSCQPTTIPIIPNIITPNGDHLNDTFEIVSGYPAGSWQVKIFNRWGKVVFDSSAYDNMWGNEATTQGIYYYLATNSAAGLSYQGAVQVLR